MLREMKFPSGPTVAALHEVDRDLVQRITLSPSFAKSPRLAHFLRFICNEKEEGRQHEINELRIGSVVFGRGPDYDPAGDSIVRSHASRLRRRLEEYFETDGKQEPTLLTIPKGGYVPCFLPRAGEANAPPPVETLAPENAVPAIDNSASSAGSLHRPDRAVRFWQIAFVAASAAAVACASMLLAHLAGPRHRTQHMFWSGFLDPHHGPTMVVEADSGLVILQHFTHRPVSLAAYVSGDYLRDISSPDGKLEAIARLSNKRYTPVLGTAFFAKLIRLLPDSQETIHVRFARDVRIDDLKHGNAILLGSRDSDPWVELFENSLNFAFHHDRENGTTAMVNRHPHAGELAVYPMLTGDPQHTVYRAAR